MIQSIEKLRSDCGQFILPIKILQNLPSQQTYKLLDVGAGEHYIKPFLPKNIKYYSLDYAGDQDIIHNLDCFPIPAKDGYFDIILCLEALEHTLYPHKIMKELLRIGKPEALFLLSMPNEYNFYCRLNFLLGKKTEVQKPFKVIEEHHHIQLPRTKDIINFFSEYIKIEEIDYQWYSRVGGHSTGFKQQISIFIDRLINKFSKSIPSLLARTVVVRGKRKEHNSNK